MHYVNSTFIDPPSCYIKTRNHSKVCYNYYLSYTNLLNNYINEVSDITSITKLTGVTDITLLIPITEDISTYQYILYDIIIHVSTGQHNY